MKTKTTAGALGMALVATLTVAVVPAHADGGTATKPAEKRFVYVPHKSGYPINFYFEPTERAEFARVEIDPEKRGRRILPTPKSGHPHLIRN